MVNGRQHHKVDEVGAPIALVVAIAGVDAVEAVAHSMALLVGQVPCAWEVVGLLAPHQIAVDVGDLEIDSWNLAQRKCGKVDIYLAAAGDV